MTMCTALKILAEFWVFAEAYFDLVQPKSVRDVLAAWDGFVPAMSHLLSARDYLAATVLLKTWASQSMNGPRPFRHAKEVWDVPSTVTDLLYYDQHKSGLKTRY